MKLGEALPIRTANHNLLIKTRQFQKPDTSEVSGFFLKKRDKIFESIQEKKAIFVFNAKIFTKQVFMRFPTILTTHKR